MSLMSELVLMGSREIHKRLGEQDLDLRTSCNIVLISTVSTVPAFVNTLRALTSSIRYEICTSSAQVCFE